MVYERMLFRIFKKYKKHLRKIICIYYAIKVFIIYTNRTFTKIKKNKYFRVCFKIKYVIRIIYKFKKKNSNF